MNDIETAVSSTLSEEGKIEVSKLVKQMDFLCSIYDADFRVLVEEKRSGVGEDLSAHVDFVLIDQLYNVPTNRKNEHADYDVFGSNDLKNVAKVLGDLIKLGASRHVFCFVLQITLWRKALLSE